MQPVKMSTYVLLVLIVGVMIAVIVFITKTFSTTCQNGYHYDYTAKRCIPTCSGKNINQPTLDYQCSPCQKGYVVNNNGICVKSCTSNGDCPKSSTGAAQQCVNKMCTDQVWTCNKTKNGSVCVPLEGDVPSGTTIYSTLKDCITSGCKCDKNWEWNASMDACNTYSCTKNALDGWGSNVPKDRESTPSTLFSPYQQSDGGTCLPVTDDGTPGAPSDDGICSTATDRETCFRTGSEDNKLSCRWFPDTVCNRIMPNNPWNSCTCPASWCIGDCNTKAPNNGYTLTKCHNVGGSAYCRSNIHVNDKVVSNCAKKYKDAGGTGTTTSCPQGDQPYNPLEFKYCTLKPNDNFEWVSQPISSEGVGDYVATNGIDKELSNYTNKWCPNAVTKI